MNEALARTEARPPERWREIQIFAVRTAHDPQALSRVLQPFAQSGLVPRQLMFRRAEEDLLIDIEVEPLSTPRAQRILDRLSSLILVKRATLVGNGVE